MLLELAQDSTEADINFRNQLWNALLLRKKDLHDIFFQPNNPVRHAILTGQKKLIPTDKIPQPVVPAPKPVPTKRSSLSSQHHQKQQKLKPAEQHTTSV